VKLHLYRQDNDNKHVADALTANERAHARSLVDALAETSPVISQGVSSNLLQKKQTLAETINSKAQNRQELLNEWELQQRAYENNPTPPRSQALKRTEHRLASLAADIQRLLSEADDLETQLRKDSPGYATLTAPQALTLNQIQSELLDDKTILLEYSLGDRRSFAFVVTPTSITAVELPKREEIELVAQRLGAALIARNSTGTGETESRRARLAKANTESTEAASRLSRMVIDPVASLLGEKRILLVADGALQLIPFALLQLPSQSDQAERTAAATVPRLLIEQHEIISLPSASVLAVQRHELQGRKPASYAVAVLANPVFDSSDPRLKTAKRTGAGKGGTPASEAGHSSAELSRNVKGLPESVLRSFSGTTPRWLPSTLDEAKAIEAVAPRGQTMLALDFKASRATATSAVLSQYKIVHFATHGIADSEHPELSGIILSLVDENGVQQDGYLRLHEIYNLKLPAELVVLSACELGVGKQLKGEGLIALTRGFMYAGAASVVASLWKVEDAATAALMTEFYKEMFRNGKKPGAALRAAQLTISKQKRWREPYFWAGFVIQGEWR
jgi:CHAT domain-containing protein